MLHFRLTEVCNQKAFSFVQEIVLQITTLSTVFVCHQSIIQSVAMQVHYAIHMPRGANLRVLTFERLLT